MVRANRPATSLLADLTGSGDNQNFMRMILADGPMKEMTANRQELAQTVLIRLHCDYERAPGDLQIKTLFEEARGLTPDITIPTDVPMTPVLNIDLQYDGEALSTFATVVSFGSAQDVVLRHLSIVHMFPRDAATEAFFQSSEGPG